MKRFTEYLNGEQGDSLVSPDIVEDQTKESNELDEQHDSKDLQVEEQVNAYDNSECSDDEEEEIVGEELGDLVKLAGIDTPVEEGTSAEHIVEKTFNDLYVQLEGIERKFRPGSMFMRKVTEIGGETANFPNVLIHMKRVHNDIEEIHHEAMGHLGSDE